MEKVHRRRRWGDLGTTTRSELRFPAFRESIVPTDFRVRNPFA